jgi:hypothetical protein
MEQLPSQLNVLPVLKGGIISKLAHLSVWNVQMEKSARQTEHIVLIVTQGNTVVTTRQYAFDVKRGNMHLKHFKMNVLIARLVHTQAMDQLSLSRALLHALHVMLGNSLLTSSV